MDSLYCTVVKQLLRTGSYKQMTLRLNAHAVNRFETNDDIFVSKVCVTAIREYRYTVCSILSSIG